MAAILDEDLERSWLDVLIERIDTERRFGRTVDDAGDTLAIDIPGLIFRAKAQAIWIEPRLTQYVPTEANLRVPWEDVVLQVRCFTKVEAKGDRSLVLSQIVDEVRRVIDPRRRTAQNAALGTADNPAGIINILNCDGKRVGILQCSPPSERRAYNQEVNIRGDRISGLDVASLQVPCKLTPAEVCG